jgi:hypothetical protein
MLPVKIRRVILAHHRVDFRKGPDGLLGEAYLLGADPYSGDCVVFVKRDLCEASHKSRYVQSSIMRSRLPGLC